jgi:MFS superfamily sulfate permease-like transporter
MTAAAVVVGVALAIILVISAVVTLRVVLRRRDETPEDRYRRAVPDLLGGGIHPGGQPSKPPRPNNLSGGGGAY